MPVTGNIESAVRRCRCFHTAFSDAFGALYNKSFNDWYLGEPVNPVSLGSQRFSPMRGSTLAVVRKTNFKSQVISGSLELHCMKRNRQR